MDTTLKILRSLTRFQECSGLLRHGQNEAFDGLNIAEVHSIDRIGSMEHANVTRIANDMDMTRGAISKISRKLLGKGLIESYQRDENKKEIYFRLTPQGERIFDAHKKCHSHATRERIALLSAYSEDEQSIILNFLNDMNRQIDGKLASDSLGHDCCAGGNE